MILLNFIDFSFEFEEDKPLLEHVNFAIEKGSKVGVHGPQGSGKSIFLRMLTGNYTDFVGSLLINQIPIFTRARNFYGHVDGEYYLGPNRYKH